MKHLIFTLLISSFAMAEWYDLSKLNCRFTNGTTLEYSSKNPSVAIGSYGVMKKQYKAEYASKVVYSETYTASKRPEMSWQISDPATTKFNLNFNLNPKTVQLNKVMTGVTVVMSAYVPAMVPVWYPVGTYSTVATGSCEILLKEYTGY